MSINYALYKNHLTSDPRDCMALVQIKGSADLEDIIDRMSELGTTVTRTDIVAVVEDTIRATESLLLDGFRVNLGGLVQLFPSIKGVFESTTDTFDKSRHRLHISALPGTRLKKKVSSNATVEKTKGAKTVPVPLEYIDIASESSDSTITPGSIGTINGNSLNYDSQKDDEGIFFINTENGTSSKVSIIQKNKPSQLVFQIPDSLTSGETYSLEVRTRYSGESKLREGSLEYELTAS